MTSAATSAPFMYVESDVPMGQTLVEWRRERLLEQHNQRPALVRAARRLRHLHRS